MVLDKMEKIEELSIIEIEIISLEEAPSHYISTTYLHVAWFCPTLTFNF